MYHRANDPAAEGGDGGAEVVHLPDADGKVAAHPGAQHLRRPGIGALPVDDQRAGAEGGGAADDRADVAGILHALEKHRWAGTLHVRERKFGGDARRRLGVGDRPEHRGRQHDRGELRLAHERGHLGLGERGFRAEDGDGLEAGC